MPNHHDHIRPYGLSYVYGQVFMLGLVSMLVQIVMLREFMFVFGGNELIIGIMLANWMVLTGIGAYLGKTAIRIGDANRFSRIAIAVLGWIPPVLLFIVEFFRNIVFKPGAEIGFFQIMASSAVLITPFCLLSGLLFTCLSGIVSQYGLRIPAEKTYAVESAGSMAAGILSSFVLFFLLSNFQIMILLPLCTSLMLLFPLSGKGLRAANIVVAATAVGIVSALFLLKADYRLKTIYFMQQEVLFFKDTPFGNLAVTKNADQLSIFDNGKLLFSTDNPIANEEAVHYAMAQHPAPRHVLLISGGISGITHEILKYDVERIDYLEINPMIFTIGKRYTDALDDSRIHLIRKDARIFLQETENSYDVVLVNLPEPSTAQLNRYFTLEFLQQVKKKMKQPCIVSLNMPSTANYISDEAIRLNSIIYNTCRQVFSQVLIIPGERNYYLASDSPLTMNISYIIKNKDIENVYLNENYIDTLSLQERSRYLLDHLDSGTLINKDFRPVSYFYYLGYWLSQFNLGKSLLWAIFALLVILLLAGGIFFKPVTSALMITGFSASSLEVILLLSLQILSGYIYQAVGICMAVIMGGLAAGALSRVVLFPNASAGKFFFIQSFTGALAILIPSLLGIKALHSGLLHSLLFILLLLFVISFASGILFSMAFSLRPGNFTDNIATLYSADLVGSALGAFLTSIFLVPLLGIMNTSYMVGLLLMIYALNLFLRRKHMH